MGMIGFPFPATIPDWLSWIFCRFQWNGTPLPGEPAVNYLSPLVATDNPTNKTIDVSLSGGVLAFAGEISSSTFAAAANTSIVANASLNSVAISAPGTPTLGTRIQVAATPLASLATNTVTLTDTVNPTVLFQNPLDLELYSTMTWGLGSGGGANPQLPKGYCATWQKASVTVAGVTTIYWQWVQG